MLMFLGSVFDFIFKKYHATFPLKQQTISMNTKRGEKRR